APDVVGGEVGHGDVALDPHAGGDEARREGVGGHGRGASHSSGAVVRSPAPSVSTTSPGRARRGTCATRSARRGRYVTGCSGWASRTARSTSRPDTPGCG